MEAEEPGMFPIPRKDGHCIVRLVLQTHSARKFPVGGENTTLPSITLRDIRFAVLLERFLQEADLAHPEADYYRSINLGSWEAVLEQYPWTE